MGGFDRFNGKDLLTFLKACGKKTFHSVYSQHGEGLIKVSDVLATFDIETTSTYMEGNKFAFMYEWSFCLIVSRETVTFYGREWQEFRELLSLLHKYYLLGSKRKMIIWVHNLSYEFQFIRKELDGDWIVFAGDVRKPYKAEIQDFIFRDTLILSAMSLAKVADNLQKHSIEKLLGDLDYTKTRTSITPMTEQELAYCKNDVLIVAYYISEQIDLYGDITKIPLTNTGRVRRFVKDKCFHSAKSHKKDSRGKNSRYRALMAECTLDESIYKSLLLAFQGGFTHANPCHAGQVLEGVHSIDFTSSYPAVMLSELFPMSRGERVTFASETEFLDAVADNGKGLLFTVKFYRLQAKIAQDNYLSVYKAIQIEKPTINNGRIFAADSASFVVTDIDFQIIQSCYSWEGYQMGDCYQFYMSYLPRAIIEAILELYTKKTTLKGVEGKEVEYLVSKGMLNSVYGMSVTSVVKDENIYDGEWTVKPADYREQIKTYNENKQRFLYYPWGVWVTAYARRNLWKGILAIGEDYIYSDTDSIKFLNLERHKTFIDEYNRQITSKIQTMLDFYHLDYQTPKTIKGKEKPIGVWDYEGEYSKFKTLGAKRYMYEKDGRLSITIAGLSKKAGRGYIAGQEKPFEFFNNEMYIPASFTGKMTHTYIDEPLEYDIIDYTGASQHVRALSSVHLEPAEFTLTQSRLYLDFLEGLANGELLTSLK